MKLLHTTDWHVGKAMRGHSRADEHEAVLTEITVVAAAEAVDVVLVTETCSRRRPPPRSRRPSSTATSWTSPPPGPRSWSSPATTTTPAAWPRSRPCWRWVRSRCWPSRRRPTPAGWSASRRRARRSTWPCCPSCPSAGSVKADDLMADDAVDHSATYAERVRRLVEHLTDGLDGEDAVNLLAATPWSAAASWAAVSARPTRSSSTSCPVRPSPARCTTPPSATSTGPSRCRVRPARPGTPGPRWPSTSARRPIARPCWSSRRSRVPPPPCGRSRWSRAAGLRTLRGDLTDLRALASDVGDAWLRVVVTSPPRRPGRGGAGAAPQRGRGVGPARRSDRGRYPCSRLGRSPDELFAEYLAEQDAADERLLALFRELHDELSDSGRPMRPERLELEGFTAFRETVVVDFDDADFFAFSGPTGLGQVEPHRRDLLRPLRHGARVRRPPAGGAGHQPGPPEARVRFTFALGEDEYTAVRVVRRTATGRHHARPAWRDAHGAVASPATQGSARRSSSCWAPLRALHPVRGAAPGGVRPVPARQAPRPPGAPGAPPRPRRATSACAPWRPSARARADGRARELEGRLEGELAAATPEGRGGQRRPGGPADAPAGRGGPRPSRPSTRWPRRPGPPGPRPRSRRGALATLRAVVVPAAVRPLAARQEAVAAALRDRRGGRGRGRCRRRRARPGPGRAGRRRPRLQGLLDRHHGPAGRAS